MNPVDDELALPSGLRIATRRFGNGARRVLALHGWLDNVASFAPLAAHLDDVSILAVDLPGHGQSSWKSADAEYHYSDWVPAVWDILDALSWTDVTLVGHSMGAGIAALFAGVFPTRIQKLVMLEGLGPYTTAPDDAVENMRRAIEARPVHFGRQPRVMASIDEAVERKLAALPYLGDAVARALCERGTRPTHGGVSFSHDPRLTGRSLLRMTEPQVLAILSRIAAPTLIVWARDGLQYPEDSADAEARMAAIPDAQIVQIEGHHHVHMTDPERVASHLRNFLKC